MKLGKKQVSGILGLWCLSVGMVFASEEVPFTDVASHWAKEDIQFMQTNEVVSGYTDHTFHPNEPIRIAEFLKMILEIADEPLVVQEVLWPDTYIATAKEKHWIEEMEIQEALQPLTRYEMAEILAQYLNLEQVSKAKNVFSDIAKESKERKDIILKLVQRKILQGYEDGTFRGEKIVTRAEACHVIKLAYEKKQVEWQTQTYDLTPENTNIGQDVSSSRISNRYEVKQQRLYFYDQGRYGHWQGQTLNQEYCQDRTILAVVKALVDDTSYTEIKFVPDAYIINQVVINYGRKESSVYQGANHFQISFYENGYYNVAQSIGEPSFTHRAMVKIQLGKMWDLPTELTTDAAASEKNLAKLEAAIGAIVGKKEQKKIMTYLLEKRIEAKELPEVENDFKLKDVKTFGAYTINVYCKEQQNLVVFLEAK